MVFMMMIMIIIIIFSLVYFVQLPQNSPLSQGGHIAGGTKKALFYHAKPHPHGFHCEA